MQIFCWWPAWPEPEQLHHCKQVQSENTVQDIWKASSRGSEPSTAFQPFSLQQEDKKFNVLLQNSEQTGGPSPFNTKSVHWFGFQTVRLTQAVSEKLAARFYSQHLCELLWNLRMCSSCWEWWTSGDLAKGQGCCTERRVDKSERPNARHIPASTSACGFQHVHVCNHGLSQMSPQGQLLTVCYTPCTFV